MSSVAPTAIVGYDPHDAVAVTFAIEFEGGDAPVLFFYDRDGNHVRVDTHDTRVVYGFEVPCAWELVCH